MNSISKHHYDQDEQVIRDLINSMIDIIVKKKILERKFFQIIDPRYYENLKNLDREILKLNQKIFIAILELRRKYPRKKFTLIIGRSCYERVQNQGDIVFTLDIIKLDQNNMLPVRKPLKNMDGHLTYFHSWDINNLDIIEALNGLFDEIIIDRDVKKYINLNTLIHLVNNSGAKILMEYRSSKFHSKELNEKENLKKLFNIRVKNRYYPHRQYVVGKQCDKRENRRETVDMYILEPKN